MKDQFVTYEIAKRLKELGFNEPCIMHWFIDDEYHEYGEHGNKKIPFLRALVNSSGIKDGIKPSQVEFNVCAPLWQQAIDWLREKGFNVSIIENPYTQGPGPGMYEWSIKPRMPKNQSLPQPHGYGSGCGQQYEQAREAAIFKAIKLINN